MIKNIYIYNYDKKEHSIITNKFNIKIIKKLNIINMTYNDILIISNDDNNLQIDKFLKLTKKMKIIVFTNILKYSNDPNFIYYKNIEELEKNLKIIKTNFNKTFTILIPIYNSFEYLDKCVNSVINQTFENYKIFLLDDHSNIEQYNKYKEKYSNHKNIFLFRNSQNFGKFLSINLVLNKVKTNYFLVLDSDDKLNKNRLLLDLLNFNKEKKKIYAVQSKYIRYNVDKSNIIEYNYGHNSISFRKNIIDMIGYYCPNRFGSDTEYLMRIKKFIGKNAIKKYNYITYLSYTRKNNTNLTKIYDKQIRKKFIEIILTIYSNINNQLVFLNPKLDYFGNIFKYDNNNILVINEYKKMYLDISNLTDKQAKTHWETYGLVEGRIPNISKFKYTYPNFNWRFCIFKFSDKFPSNEYEVYGIVYLKNKLNYIEWLNKNNYIEKKLSINKILNNNELIISFEKIIKINNIEYINVSKALKHFESRICEKFNLRKYNKLCDKFEKVVFFGLYDNEDYEKITNHIGIKYLMWGGTDSNIQYDFRKVWVEKISNYLDISNLAISDDIYKSLNDCGIEAQRIYLNMVDTNIFKPVENLGSSIYIYNGFTKGNEEIYGKSVYEEVIKKLPEYKYIFSNELGLEYSTMPEVYSQCFIGLRLTSHDGNANTIQEFNAMNIPIIFNGDGGIDWTDSDDIVKKIIIVYKETIIYNNIILIKKKSILEEKNIILEEHRNNDFEIEEYKNNEMEEKIMIEEVNKKSNIINLIDEYDEIYEYDFFNNDFTNDDLDNIYGNINNFVKLFVDIKNILFICGDYPGYGGAATNCDKIQEYFIKNNFDTYAIYYNYQGETNIKLEKNNKYEIIHQMDLNQKLHNLNFKPDAIIIKSACYIDLKKIFNCPIIFLISGIFKNDLNKYYNELNDDKFEKYINKDVINQIKQSDLSFCNSSHTKQILLNKFNLMTYLFYSGFVQFYGLKISDDDNWINRKYQYGLFVSDFDRKIKNIEKSINFLKDKEKVILIGKNSYKYKNYGFECIDLVDNSKIFEYYDKIKYIVQDSFYESCSNVKIECYFKGCFNISSMHCDLLKYVFDYNIFEKKKNIYFVSFTEWESGKLRGENIVNNLDLKKYCNTFYININRNFNDKFKNNFEILKTIKNSIIIFIKGNIKNINNLLNLFSKNNNIFIHDILDIYDKNNIKYIKYENMFDYIWCNSYHMKNKLIYYNIDPNKIYVIYHPCDHRLKHTTNINNNLIYLGNLDKCDIDIEKYGIKHLSFNIKLDRCIYFTYVTKEIMFDFHTSTKLATAIKTKSILITNKISIFVELLGYDYPFYIDDLENLNDLFHNALTYLYDEEKYEMFYSLYYKKNENLLIDNVNEYINFFNKITDKSNIFNVIAVYKCYFVDNYNDKEKFNFNEIIKNYDYYIFTNSKRNFIDFLPYIKINIDIDYEKLNYNNKILSRIFKWFGYIFFKKYEYCIYMDSYFHTDIKNIHIYDKIFQILETNKNIKYIVDKHKCRNNIIEEINCVLNKWSDLNDNQNVKEYSVNLIKLLNHINNFEKKKKDEIMNKQLSQNGIIFLKTKDINFNLVNKMIKYIFNYTYRDQCILNIVDYEINCVEIYVKLQNLFLKDLMNNNCDYKYI
jgi:hypothetical protein